MIEENETAAPEEKTGGAAPGPATAETPRKKRRSRSGASRSRARKAAAKKQAPAGEDQQPDAPPEESMTAQAGPEPEPAGPPGAEAGETSAEASTGEQVAAEQAVEPQAAPEGNKKARGGRRGQKKPKTEKKPPEAESPAVAKPTEIKLLINAEEPEECRIARLEGGKIESFHVATSGLEQTRHNIYKGRISAIEPNLQAAFVDIGLEKNGFLPFAEIHPEYYDSEVPAGRSWKELRIQELVRRGQEVLVQVVKEAVGTKGANLTTYLSIPGRFLVLMPGSDSAGVSRKIEDEEQRSRLRELMKDFALPEGIGYIVRTASQDMTKTALGKDLRYLLRLWKEIKARGQSAPTPSLIYKDQDIIAKFLRDHFNEEIQEILLDTQEAFDQVSRFLELLPARQKTTRVRLHKGPKPIFNQYDVEDQIEQIYQPMVRLPSGGSIVINPTEALVAIDVNSGRTAKDKDFNETIFLANMEAAAEAARQLRLRDLGGLIVVDFIDMRNPRHIREVEKQVKTSMKRDKAKVDISRISKFGLMQISRQKMGTPIQSGSYRLCEHCQGRGMVRSVETQALLYLRRIHTGVANKKVRKVNCRLPMAVAQYLLNVKREDLIELEKVHQVEIRVEPVPDMKPEEQQIDFLKE